MRSSIIGTDVDGKITASVGALNTTLSQAIADAIVTASNDATAKAASAQAAANTYTDDRRNGLVETTTGPGGGIGFDARTSDGIRATMIDRRGTGKPIYRPNGSVGLTFSAGARAPAAIQIIDGVAWITTPVGDYVEVTLPALSARLAPQTLCIDAEADNWSACTSVTLHLATTGYTAFWLRSFNPSASGNTGSSEVSGQGRRRMFSDRSALIGTNNPDFNTTQITTHKIRVTPKAGQQVRFCIRGIDWDLHDVPSISNIYDDGYTSVYQHALPLHNELGLVS